MFEFHNHTIGRKGHPKELSFITQVGYPWVRSLLLTHAFVLGCANDYQCCCNCALHNGGYIIEASTRGCLLLGHDYWPIEHSYHDPPLKSWSTGSQEYTRI